MARTLDDYQNEIAIQSFKTRSNVTDTVIRRAVNDAKNIIMQETGGQFDWLEATSLHTVPAGDYRATLPANFINFIDSNSVVDETNGARLEILTAPEFRRQQTFKSPHSVAPTTSEQSTPSICSILSDIIGDTSTKYLFVDPPVLEATNLRLHYYREISDLENGTDEFIDMPSFVEAGIEFYALYRMTLLKSTEESITALSQVYKNEWNEFLLSLNRAQSTKDRGAKKPINFNPQEFIARGK